MDTDSIIITFMFLSHLFFFFWAILDFMNIGYAVYNAFLFICLLWAVHETRSSAPPFVALSVNLMSILLDVVLIAILWSDYRSGFRFVLSILASFGNLFYRFITSFILYRIWNKRRESETNHETVGTVTRDLTKYLNFSRPMDPPPQPSQPSHPERAPERAPERNINNIALP